MNQNLHALKSEENCIASEPYSAPLGNEVGIFQPACTKLLVTLSDRPDDDFECLGN